MIVQEPGDMSEVSVIVGAENANRHIVACPAQTNPSTEAGNPGAHDDNVHGSGKLYTTAVILQ